MKLIEILDNVVYDTVFVDGSSMHGTIEYISQHFGDSIAVDTQLSKNQPACVSEFCKKLFSYNAENGTKLSIKQFYELSKEN